MEVKLDPSVPRTMEVVVLVVKIHGIARETPGLEMEPRLVLVNT